MVMTDISYVQELEKEVQVLKDILDKMSGRTSGVYINLFPLL